MIIAEPLLRFSWMSRVSSIAILAGVETPIRSSNINNLIGKLEYSHTLIKKVLPLRHYSK